MYLFSFATTTPTTTKQLLRTCSEPDVTKLFSDDEEENCAKLSANENLLVRTKRFARSLEVLNEEENEKLVELDEQYNKDKQESGSDDNDDVIVKLISTLTMKNNKMSDKQAESDDISIVRENMQSFLLSSSSSSSSSSTSSGSDLDDADNNRKKNKPIKTRIKIESPTKKNVHFASANCLISAMSISKSVPYDSLEPNGCAIVNKKLSDDLDCESVSLSKISFLFFFIFVILAVRIKLLIK